MSFMAYLRDAIQGMPFTASTLQIGGYHSYQHRKLQAAQFTSQSRIALFLSLRLHQRLF